MTSHRVINAAPGSPRIAWGRSPILWIPIAALLTTLLRLPFLALPMISDEGGYAYATVRWLDGRGQLYHDLWISRPQGIFAMYALIFEAIGTDVIALRIGALVATLLTMLLVWRFASAWAGQRVAAVAVLLFAVLSASPAIEGFTANAEVFMALPSAACVLLLLRAARNGSRWAPLASAGALAAIATLLKPSAVTLLPMGVVFFWLMTQADARLTLRRSAWFLGGAAAAFAPAIIHGYALGWDEFVFATITYRMNHQSSLTNPVVHHVGAVLDMASRCWPLLVVGVVPVVIQWWNAAPGWGAEIWTRRLAEAPRLGIVANPPRSWPVRRVGDAELLLRLWLLASLAGIAMGGDWWVHYLVQVVAPFSIWLAMRLVRVHRMLTARAGLAMIAVIMMLLTIPLHVLAEGNDAEVSQAIFHHGGYGDQEAVAAYLREHTAPETTIYAAFNEAALYYLADRPSSYRYLFDQELLAFPDSQQRLIRMVSSPERPEYIIGTRQVAPFEDRGRAFWAEVSKHYHLVAVVHGVPIFRANDPVQHVLLS